MMIIGDQASTLCLSNIQFLHHLEEFCGPIARGEKRRLFPFFFALPWVPVLTPMDTTALGAQYFDFFRIYVNSEPVLARLKFLR